MKWLRRLGLALAALLGAVLLVGLGARFSDGPLGPFPGGPLQAGAIVSESAVDWAFAESIEEMEFQLLDPPRSRTVWLLVHEGDLYVPCGLPSLRIWKWWPHEARRDGRAVLRIDGKLYPRQAVYVTDRAQHRELSALLAEKYPGPAGYSGQDDLWFFRMEPRSEP